MLLRNLDSQTYTLFVCSAGNLLSDTQGNLIHFSGVSLYTRLLFSYGHVLHFQSLAFFSL